MFSDRKTIRHLAHVSLTATLLISVASSVVRADFTFGPTVNLGPTINSSSYDGAAVISPDDLELYFCSARPGGLGAEDIWVAKRASAQDAWGTPVNAGPLVNSAKMDTPDSMSADGLTLYLSSNRPGGYGNSDLYMSTRPTREAPWGPAVNLGPIVNSAANDMTGAVSGDGLELFFTSGRGGGLGSLDVWVSTRASVSAPWNPPVNLGPAVNSPTHDYVGCISPDGLRLFFSSFRGFGNYDIWMAARPSKGAAWSAAVNLGRSLNTVRCDWPCSISRDGRTLYLEDGMMPRPGGLGGGDIWQVPIIPTVDFNGDGTVDAQDVGLLLDHWGKSDSLWDIGPMPWGDGMIDVQDWSVLGAHLFEKVLPPVPPAAPTFSGTLTEDPPGQYTMTARGTDIWWWIDQFHFAYRTLSGPGSIIARVDTVTKTNAWAKAGLMIRETLEDGSKHAFVCVTPGQGVAFQHRAETESDSYMTAQQGGITTPHWVKLERDAQGNFTASHSDDGFLWEPVAGTASVNIPMNRDVYVGLALTSHSAGATCEARFTNVSTTGTVTSPWKDQDIGFLGQP